MCIAIIITVDIHIISSSFFCTRCDSVCGDLMTLLNKYLINYYYHYYRVHLCLWPSVWAKGMKPANAATSQLVREQNSTYYEHLGLFAGCWLDKLHLYFCASAPHFLSSWLLQMHSAHTPRHNCHTHTQTLMMVLQRRTEQVYQAKVVLIVCRQCKYLKNDNRVFLFDSFNFAPTICVQRAKQNEKWSGKFIRHSTRSVVYHI